MIKKITLLLCCLSLGFASIHAQVERSPVALEIEKKQSAFESLPPLSLLQQVTEKSRLNVDIQKDLAAATLLSLERKAVNYLLSNRPGLLTFSLPVADEAPVELQLYKVNVLTPEFQVKISSTNGGVYPYEGGAYYWGIVKGDPSSLAAIAVTRDEVMGLVSMKGDNYTLGKLENQPDDTHVFFRESDMKIMPDFECGTDDVAHYIGDDEPVVAVEKTADNCVRMYVEIDNDMVSAKGGVTQAVDYVLGAFSQVAILYANESINLMVNEILAWDTTDPYTGTSTSDYLYQFRDHLNGTYNGDLAHLVGTRGGGGIAYVNVLCNGFYGVAYSDINTSYANVPTYSWTVEVLTHEIGHNLGSRHTHACVWNGNNTPIDCCGPVANSNYNESSCGSGYSCDIPLPNVGTIMSYCHLVSGVGISFDQSEGGGFGPQPGDLIRDRVNNATCLTSCPVTYANDAGIASVASPAGTTCENSVTPEVLLSNYGENTLTSVSIQYQVDAATPATYNWTGSLATGASTSVALPAVTYANGAHTFTATTVNPNGVADENTANDAASSNFNRPDDQTWYQDLDQDGYGNATVAVVDCIQPSGYVTDATDCDDNDGAVNPGAAEICNGIDDNCDGQIDEGLDQDGDGISDCLDNCPDTPNADQADSDGDGIGDACECSPATTSFPVSSLTDNNGGASETTVSLAAGDEDPSFTISGLDAVSNGNPNNRYTEQVIVTYVDENNNPVTYGTFSGEQQSEISVSISGVVQSITVRLEDSYDGSYNGMSISLSTVDYCQGCIDADEDGICDNEDICPGFDDNLLGLPCDDGNACTADDTWTGCNECTGTYVDSDGDGICDIEDNCPLVANPGQEDSDGDGVGDACDNFNCSNELISQFDPNSLIHSGLGASTVTLDFPLGNADVSFTISELDAQVNGNPRNRYTDRVIVTYNDGNSDYTYGTFTGDQQNTVNVSIMGAVQSVSIRLEDGSGQFNDRLELRVSMSSVTSCLPSLQGNDPGVSGTPQALVQDIQLFPNPAKEQVTLTFARAPEQAEVILTNLLGQPLGRYQVAGSDLLQIDLAQLNIGTQYVLVTVYLPDSRPVTKRLMLLKE